MKQQSTPTARLAMAMSVGAGLTMSALAADIDVIATQTSFNATYGLDMLSGDTTWTSDNVYILTDRLYVPEGVTLTIDPGTKIYSSFNQNGTPEDSSDDLVGAVIVCRGARIEANGTAAEPIIFDAIANLEAERGLDTIYDPDNQIGPKPTPSTRGLWGGVVILGNAYIAVTDNETSPGANDGPNIGNKIIEGFVPTGFVDGDNDTRPDVLEYGWDKTTNTVGTTFDRDDADDSGVFKYVSIRHGGYEFGTDNEINGLTLAGVGAGTEIHHVEVVSNADDGVEFFGGTVSTSYMAVAFCDDDGFDIDEGHGGPDVGGNPSGVHQFWFVLQNPDTGDNMGEWDGVGGSNKASTLTGDPQTEVIRSNPKIYNATFVGPGEQSFTNGDNGKDNGIFMDDYFNGELYNSILSDSVNFLTSFAGDGDGGSIVFSNNTVGFFGQYDGSLNASVLNSAPTDYYISGFGAPNNANTAAGTDPNFGALDRTASGFVTQIDPIPSPLDATVAAGAPVAAPYRGAFNTGDNWLEGWSYLDEENFFDAKVAPTIVDVIATQTAFNSTYGLATLAADTTWTAGNVYVLTDRLYVPEGLTLTIDPGVKIYSTFSEQGTPEDASDDTVGALIVCRGGMIEAAGNAGAPIVFDALQTLEAECNVDFPYDDDNQIGPCPTATSFGLWGGVVVLGNAYIAVTDNETSPGANDGPNIGNKIIEGFVPTGFVDGDNDTRPDVLEYGWDKTTNTVGTTFDRDDADDSGTLQYISIRHGGYEFGTDNEINGLTLAGVGSGTTIDHIEVVANLDDGVEFFGGTVSTCNMVVAFCGDDCFDIDEGHGGPSGGEHNYWFAIQNPNTGDNLGEWDGVGGSNKGSTLTGDPQTEVIRSAPKIYNGTFVGPGATLFTNSDTGKDNGIFMDDYFNGQLINSVITDSVNFLTSFAGDGNGGGINFQSNTVGSFGRYNGSSNASVLNAAPANYYIGGFGDTPNKDNTNAETDPGFAAFGRSFNGFLLGIDPRPAAGSSPLVDPVFDGTANGAKTAAHRGAFDDTTNWALGWTFLDENGLFEAGALVDSDGDNLTDADEAILGTDPNNPDTDGDGIRDDIEAFNLGLGFDPVVPDANAVLGDVATSSQLLDIGYFAAGIDSSSGNAILTLFLEGSTTLEDFSEEMEFDVGLPSGTRFYRFTDGN